MKFLKIFFFTLFFIVFNSCATKNYDDQILVEYNRQHGIIYYYDKETKVIYFYSKATAHYYIMLDDKGKPKLYNHGKETNNNEK